MIGAICDICGVSNSTRDVGYSEKYQKYLCSRHYAQLHYNGRITDASVFSRSDPNEINIKEDYAEIIIRDKNHKIAAITKIDIEDVDKCKEYKWRLQRGYIRGSKRNSGKKNDDVFLHRYIMNYYGELDIDHINRDSFNNRKSNLRIADRITNNANNGGLCVYRDKYHRNKQWIAAIRRYGKEYKTKSFATKDEAIIAANELKNWLNEHNDELYFEYLENKEQLPTGILKLPSGNYRAIFYKNGKKHHVGTYKTKEEAIAARAKAIQEYMSKSA